MMHRLGSGPFSSAFTELGIDTFEEACAWVKRLTYKRNSITSNPLKVVDEKCGTCSSKHELIKRLADENGIHECKLVLCIFNMNGINTPKIKSIIYEHHLSFLPETHTYVVINNKIQDFTFSDNSELLFLKDVVLTEEISPDQIATYKTNFHKNYINQWIKDEKMEMSFDEIWKVREACIEALSKI